MEIEQIICIKLDLALNNLQWLIYHKKKTKKKTQKKTTSQADERKKKEKKKKRYWKEIFFSIWNQTSQGNLWRNFKSKIQLDDLDFPLGIINI